MQPHLQQYVLRGLGGDSSGASGAVPGTPQYKPVTAICICEAFKVAMSLAMISCQAGALSATWRHWRLSDSLRIAGMASVLFAVQDWLLDFASRPQNGCAPLVFQLLNQTKTLWGALFMLMMCGTRRSGMQWVALSLLCCATLLVTAAGTPAAAAAAASSTASSAAAAAKPDDAGAAGDLAMFTAVSGGVLAVLGASLISGVNQALTELAVMASRNSDKSDCGKAHGVQDQAVDHRKLLPDVSSVFTIELAVFKMGTLLLAFFSAQ
jgi:hypothetical protein